VSLVAAEDVRVRLNYEPDTGQTNVSYANKWICRACFFIGPLEEFTFVRDPRRDDPADGWYACNQCDAIDQITTACDEPGCTREGSCGFPVDDARRYRRTCFEHSAFNQRELVK
jgi:hypothetical protein